MIRIGNLQELYRESRKVYLSINTLECIRNWDLEANEQHGFNTECILISFSEIVHLLNGEVVVQDPKLISMIPLGKNEEQFVVIFVKQEDYLPYYLEQKLYSYYPFSRLVEKQGKLSKNSTKLITRGTLQEILFQTFSVEIPHNEWCQFSDALIKYIGELIDHHPYLGYLPVAERNKFRETYVSDLSFSWEMYFKYFSDTWTRENKIIRIPNLSKEFRKNNWKGNFFDRENPTWEEVIGKKDKMKLNQYHRELIYSIWTKWLRESQ